MQIEDNKVVAIHYTLTNDEGNTLDSSEGREPLAYLQGKGNIIKGLEAALLGKQVGDKLDVVVEPEDGYGVHRPEAVQQVPVDAFAGIDNLQPGLRLQAQTENGVIPVVVTAVDEGMVTVDANHELAGVRLHFAVSVESIRDASEEEIAHGHAH